MIQKHNRITLSELTPDTKIRETNLLDWRLRLIFSFNGIESLRQLSEYRKCEFESRFLCNEKVIINITLFLNCVKLDWKK